MEHAARAAIERLVDGLAAEPLIRLVISPDDFEILRARLRQLPFEAARAELERVGDVLIDVGAALADHPVGSPAATALRDRIGAALRGGA